MAKKTKGHADKTRLKEAASPVSGDFQVAKIMAPPPLQMMSEVESHSRLGEEEEKEESALQRKTKGKMSAPAVPPPADTSNNGGLPTQLKANLESMSGLDMGDVKVNYNSQKPAQLQALATAQGNEINLGPGQEKHLGHEAWHVVQQKKGQVTANNQVNGQSINDNPKLENDADVMGAKAMQMKAKIAAPQDSDAKGSNSAQPPTFQLKTSDLIQLRDDGTASNLEKPASNHNFQLRDPFDTGSDLNSGMSVSLGVPSLSLDGMGAYNPAQEESSIIGTDGPNNSALSPTQKPNFADEQLIGSLRRRLPIVGGIMGESAILNTMLVDPMGSAFQDQAGNDRTNPDGSPMTQWSTLSDEQIAEQMEIRRILRERHPQQPGMEWGATKHGLGGEYNWESGESLSFGAMPNLDGGGSVGMEFRW